MRYADIWLIEAEAVMAGAQSSADPIALNAINKIRIWVSSVFRIVWIRYGVVSVNHSKIT